MRAKPSSNPRAGKSNRANGKSHGGNPKGIVKKRKDTEKKKNIPDLSVLRQPVDTSVCGLKQAVKVFETGTPEILHLLTYDCDVVYECKICRNLFRSIANFISHKRVYCTLRYSRSQDLQRSNKEAEDYTVILGEKATERLPTRITARKDLTSIVESLAGQKPASQFYSEVGDNVAARNAERKATTVHLEPMDNTSYGVFQTVLMPESQDLMRNQVTELQKLLSQNEVILGPDGRILQNGASDLHEEKTEVEPSDNGLHCSICNIKFANRKTLAKHTKLFHESVRTSFSCPCCKNYFSNLWGVYRHLYKVHRKTNEQVRRLRSQIHKKDIRVDKPVINTSNKKVTSPSKKKGENEHALRIHQDNKEWMDHFEDDWELQRCGGCGRKFERKAALISHSQICQKRIAACNRIEQNHQGTVRVVSNISPVVALSPLSCSKKPVPKPAPEKKIGIQVRMNYCKNNSTCSGSVSQVSGRQRSSSRSVLGDESDIEAVSIDGKEPFFQPGSMKNSVDMKDGSVLEQFFKNANKCRASDGVDKVNLYLNNTANRIDKLHTYEISSCKRSTFLRSSVNKSKSLEAKCLQLRSALETSITDRLKDGEKDKEVESAVYFDGNIDNTSESNTSAISSLSSQLTPLVDKSYVCEVEESIEIKNINISRTMENIPSTEADSTSMSGGGSLHMTYNSHTYTGNIKISPNSDATCEEVTTSVNSDEIPQADSNLHVDSSCLHDDEISIDLKPEGLLQHNSKHCIQESELENTISILTRNQLKAICRDDLPVNVNKKLSLDSIVKKKEVDPEVEAATREITKKKFYKYADRSKNSCSICNKKFKKLDGVYRHLPTHTQWKRYECLFNGCKFQTFLKKSCLHHVTLHTKENSVESSHSLVGQINPSKWNLKLIEKSKNLSESRNKPDVSGISNKKEIASKKLLKTVNRLSKKSVNPSITEKRKIKFKSTMQNETKRNKLSKLLNKVSTKQKLLTDFKNFKQVSSINCKKNSGTKKLKKKMLQSPKRNLPINISFKNPKSRPVENGVSVKSISTSDSDKPAVKKEKLSNISVQAKKKSAAVNKEVKEEVIIVNNVALDNEEPALVKGRSSRASSRKSSVNSVDHQKGKNLHSVVKIEDCSLSLPPVNNECLSPVPIQNPEIVEGSSLEEEESQESDRPVDDSHLQKIFMEVIFGPQPNTVNPVQPQGRPVRNKTRPKREVDFILGSQKDNDRESLEGKSPSSKRSSRSLPESKHPPDNSKKSK